ncbi:MAG: hypothetical protein HZA35_00930 [Parcubacteria group bacterium]|nr:hypothetical protein [Parcubacteria group bacterium]
MLDKDKVEKNEREMHESFCEKARELIMQEEQFRKPEGTQLVGFESEVALDTKHLEVSELEATRDAIIHEVGESADIELGAGQIEVRTPPFDILAEEGFRQLLTVYRNEFAKVCHAAHKRNTQIMRVGANPFLPIKDTPRTSKPKYTQVPDFYNTHRGCHVDTHIGLGNTQINIGFAEVVSLFQSFQINIEARSFRDAIDKMNRSFVVAPYLLALSGNARYLNCIDTHLNDMRMMAWEKSHDTRMQDVRVLSWERSFDMRSNEDVRNGKLLRIGLPERYFEDMKDYLVRAGQFPFILHNPEATLQIAIGMTWLDTRVKFIGDACVVELRILPTQPSIEEEVALMFFYIGWLVDAQIRGEKLLPINFVRENRLSAMMYGVHRPMWFMSDANECEQLQAFEGITREIERAWRGLRHLGLDQLFHAGLLHLTPALTSPSDRLGKILAHDGECIPAERMRQALKEAMMLF